MTKKQSRKQSNKAGGAEDVDGNVDKIRDILFGSQMRDYDSRIDAMEKRLVQSIERTARDMERRIERLDKYTRREVDKLSEQVKSERKDRVAEDKKNSGELSSLSEQVEAWFDAGITTPIIVPSAVKGGQMQALQEFFDLWD